MGSLVPSLSPQEAKTCEGPLTVAECHQALLGMPVGRRLALTVSLLNFTFAFGVFLRQIWWTFLIFVFLLVFFFTRSQRRGVISLTFKKGDRLDAGNW